MKTKNAGSVSKCCVLLLSMFHTTAWCGIPITQEGIGFDAAMQVDDAVLETQRGGFVSPEGLLMNIRISRESFVNNVLQPQNSFTTGNIQINGHAISAGDLTAINHAVNTVIQNNLDNRAISIITTMAIDVKNIGALVESAKSLEDIRSSQDMQALR
jgi:hypothetical protein